jgi:hypothetical protein
MFKLQTVYGSPAIESEPGASGYLIIGAEVTAPEGTNNQALTYLGISSGTTPATTYATLPSDITFDRCWIHSFEDGTDSPYLTSRMGINMTGINITVKNSRIAGFRAWEPGTQNSPQTFAFLLERGPGPYRLENNYIEAWFVPIFTGGGGQWKLNTATVTSPTLTSATLSTVANLSVGDLINR